MGDCAVDYRYPADGYMVAIMYRRLRKGMSPFSPDRQHDHHLIMRAGFTAGAFVLITWPPPAGAGWRRGGVHRTAGMGDALILFLVASFFMATVLSAPGSGAPWHEHQTNSATQRHIRTNQ